MARHALVVPSLPAGAFAASLLVVLLTPLCTRDRIPDRAAWVDAVSHSDLIRPGDVVLVHPPWRDDVATALRANGTLPRGAVATVALSPRHGDALPPLVVVTDGSAPLPALFDDLLEPAVERGGIRIARVHPRTGDAGGRSLLDGLRDAHVELRSSDDVIPCPWDALAERHVCVGQPEWQHVGTAELPVAGAQVTCAWAHPKTGAVLSIRFEHAALLDALDLSLALTDGAADNKSAAAVTAALLVDDVEVATVTKKPGARGFVKTSAATVAGEHAVEVRITTPNDGQRHTCFLLDTFPNTRAGAP